jgi:siroheme synthase-like protein
MSAVVVGGGQVATRKVRALIDSGARVRVIAPAVSRELEDLAAASESLDISRTEYRDDDLGDAVLVIAATNDAAVNAAIAARVRASGRLVNVADAPELGNCVTPAVHRRGELVVSVATGGVPVAAARIRDSIARQIDGRYAIALSELAGLRRSLLADEKRERWSEAAAALIGENFCEQVESGQLTARIAEWR